MAGSSICRSGKGNRKTNQPARAAQAAVTKLSSTRFSPALPKSMAGSVSRTFRSGHDILLPVMLWLAQMTSHFRVIPLIIASALFMENMDQTVIATSLPAIAADLGTDPIVLKLAFTTYLLSLTVFIPVSGWLADRFGAKHVFRAAILVFMLGSIACGASQSLGWLVAARAVQGIGGAMMVPVGRIIMLREIPKSQLVDALAWLTIPALLGPLVGPPIGGFITTYYDWRWIFWMNVPIGLLGIGLATRLMHDTAIEAAPPLDGRGFLLSGLGLSALVFGFTVLGRDLLPEHGPLALILLGAVCVALYLRHAARVAEPILDLRLLSNPTFYAGVVGGSLYRVGVGAIPFLVPLMLQLGFGYSAFYSGVLTCAAAAGAITMKFSTARLLRRFGFRHLLLVNGVLSCALMASYGLLSPATATSLMIFVFLAGGFLRSLQFTAMNALSYADIEKNEAGKATSLYTVAQQLSLSAGVAVAAAVLEITQWARGDLTIVAEDFSVAFFCVALIAVFSIAPFAKLKPQAGASVLGREIETGGKA
jgi:EmrB/QacA subfamily drug resistance transporter